MHSKPFLPLRRYTKSLSIGQGKARRARKAGKARKAGRARREAKAKAKAKAEAKGISTLIKTDEKSKDQSG
ncbi:MAG TPA: hypothetical protein DCZ04_10710 [Syntrophorhabdus aromaticivorans]|nr:hypothetical protein [Syntrophorhabdus aromaticivorans]